MSDESANPSCISHLSIGTNDFPRARAFYDAVMAALGCKVILEYPGAVAYGKLYPEFWVQAPIDGRPASVGNGSHVGFFADSKAQVDAFHAAALAAGARDEGRAGPASAVRRALLRVFHPRPRRAQGRGLLLGHEPGLRRPRPRPLSTVRVAA